MQLAEAIYRVGDARVASTRLHADRLEDALALAVSVARRAGLNLQGEVKVNVFWVPPRELQEMAFAGLNRVMIYGKDPYWTVNRALERPAALPRPQASRNQLEGESK